MSIVSVMPPNHFILCRPFILLPSIFPSIRDFSNKSALHIEVTKVLEFQHQLHGGEKKGGCPKRDNKQRRTELLNLSIIRKSLGETTIREECAGF